MTPAEYEAAGVERLARLMAVRPDAGRAARVRAACSAQLARNRQPAARRAKGSGVVSRVVAPVVLATFCALYVASLVATALQLETAVRERVSGQR